MGISVQPLIRKHSYLDHGHLKGLAFLHKYKVQSSCSRGGRALNKRVKIRNNFS